MQTYPLSDRSVIHRKPPATQLFGDKFPENLRSCGQRFFSGSEGPEKDF
jgi:hypothetical protein